MGILLIYLVSQLVYIVRKKFNSAAMEKSSYASLAPTSIANSAPLSIFSYCASSILMTVTNKYVLSGDFNLNFFLLAIQSAVCIVTISSLKTFGVITYRQFDREEARKWSPIAFLLVAMIYTGSKAIKYLPVPVYTIFKNLTIIIIAYGEVLWFGGKVTSMALGSFSLMVMSSVVSYFGESSDDSKSSADVYVLYLGYAWMAANCFASAAFVLFMRKRIKLTNFKDFDTMYYNNLLSIPILLVLSIVFENWSPENIEVNFPTDNRTATIVAIVFSGLSSVGISYCSAWCVRVTSSTTYSMVGALNKLPIALSGLIFFESAINFFSISSIFLGFAAGLVYAVAKQRQLKEAAMQLPTSK